MKKILLPIDFSETSDNAFVYAIEMAKIFKAELVLLHTFELPIVDSQSLPINYAVIYETIELTNFDHFKEKMPQLRTIAEERNLNHIVMSHILMEQMELRVGWTLSLEQIQVLLFQMLQFLY
jgi:nucleotide-binding universal stress UspA family protein